MVLQLKNTNIIKYVEFIRKRHRRNKILFIYFYATRTNGTNISPLTPNYLNWINFNGLIIIWSIMVKFFFSFSILHFGVPLIFHREVINVIGALVILDRGYNFRLVTLRWNANQLTCVFYCCRCSVQWKQVFSAIKYAKVALPCYERLWAKCRGISEVLRCEQSGALRPSEA